jgi:Oligosaccharyltransferase subunit Ribophorin II
MSEIRKWIARLSQLVFPSQVSTPSAYIVNLSKLYLFEDAERNKWDVGTFELDFIPQEIATFAPLKEIRHQFRPDAQPDHSALSFIFSVLTVAPWLGLIVAWGRYLEIRDYTQNLCWVAVS